MTNRDRIVRTAQGRKTDRVPLFLYMGIWRETLRNWLDEGLEADEEWRHAFGLDHAEDLYAPETLDRICSKDWGKWFRLDAGIRIIREVELGFQPPLEEVVLEVNGDRKTIRDQLGVVLEHSVGNMTVPRHISFPVT